MSQSIDFLQDYEMFYHEYLEKRASKEVLDDAMRWLKEKAKDVTWLKRFQDQIQQDFKSTSSTHVSSDTTWFQASNVQRMNLLFILNKFFNYFGVKKLDQAKWEPLLHQVSTLHPPPCLFPSLCVNNPHATSSCR